MAIIESLPSRSHVREAKLIQVLQIRSVTGKGVPLDPVREVVDYFDLKGNRLATFDPAFDSQSANP